MADLFCSVACVILVGFATFLLFYFFGSRNNRSTKVIKKTLGKATEPIEFHVKACNIYDFPVLTGWPLYLIYCICKWRFTGFLKSILLKEAERNANIEFLRQMSVPDSPTLIPQVQPTTEQHLHQKSDLKSFLRKPSNVKGFQFLCISDLVEAYKSGKTTPLQVVKNTLEAIEHSEKPSINLRAFVQFNKTAALEMAQESTRRYAENRALSVIDGVPVGVKDDHEVAGYHHRVGTTFIGEKVETDDCNLVAKLRGLGAVIIGTTNMHELGMGTTGVNPHSYYGTSRNPYDLTCYTGGSSGGSAGAVAAGLCPVAIGRDGGGSIRIPSSLCGVVGLKATFGRITGHTFRYDCYTVSHSGPICNNVRDAAIMYVLLSGRDPQYPAGMIQPEHATLEGFEKLDLSDLTLGIDWTFLQCADKDVVELFKKAVEYLKNQGASVVPIQIPELEETRIAHGVTICTELACMVENNYPDQVKNLNPETFLMTKLVDVLSPTDYYLSQKQRTRAIQFMKDIFKNVDCVLTPGSACVAKKIPENANEYGMSDVNTTIKHVRFSFLGNMTGIPGLVLPVGYNDQGLPISVQVMTSWWDEHVAFRIAHSLEGMVTKRQPRVHFNILNPKEQV